MVVVLLIIGITATLVITRVSALEGVELRSAARNLTGTIRLVYSSAVSSRVPCRIVFDLDEQAYWIEEKLGDEYVESDHHLLGRRHLPDSVFIKRIQVMDRERFETGREYLYFTPGGYVEEASIYLATWDGGRVASIFTEPMIGKAEIVLGEVSRTDWERAKER